MTANFTLFRIMFGRETRAGYMLNLNLNKGDSNDTIIVEDNESENNNPIQSDTESSQRMG